MMRKKYKDYPVYCDVIYLSSDNELTKGFKQSPPMEVLEHEEHDSKFIHSKYNIIPRGISDIDNIPELNTLNNRYDKVNEIEIGE